MTRSSVLILQHSPPETPGILADVLEAGGISVRTVRPFLGEEVPRELGDARGLVLLGGPQAVYEVDRHPFLRDELRLAERALATSTPVLGICLGSQLLAHVLGALVVKGAQKEIGWHKVALSDAALVDPIWKGIESSFTAFHWHGDVFELPKDAVSLARSDRTEHQAFRYGSCCYGLLFHMEVTETMVRDMTLAFGQEARDAGEDPNAIAEAAGDHLPALSARGTDVFEAWGAPIGRLPSVGSS